MNIRRVGDFALGWGESLVWDERRGRLYFVDCATQLLHWLDGEEAELQTVKAPSMPTGVVPTEDGGLVVVLDDGLSLFDPDAATWSPLAAYPEGLGARANDACADLEGNLITGTLNLGPAEGSSWWYSRRDGWRLLDDDISNTNGPQAIDSGDESTLVIGDTSAHYYAYPYDAGAGTVGARSVFGDVTDLEGLPDGTTVDAAGGLWCALVGGGQLVRFDAGGLDRSVALPIDNPTDVTFGGAGLDVLYVVSIGAPPDGDPGLNGALLAIDDLGARGRVEPRFSA
jgi:sugar lactone lactonase YvrE